MLRISAALVVAAALVLAPAAAASAGEPTVPSPSAGPTAEYPPTEPPQEPTLAGSLVTPICDGDVPYIGYDIVLTDPDSASEGTSATLVLDPDGRAYAIPLGTLVDGRLSGRVLWPGAEIGPNGEPVDWPGWEFIGGRWVVADDEFAWTRSITDAEIRVNPEVAVPLSYPPSTPSCATSPTNPSGGGASAAGSALSSTGVSEWTMPVAVGALALLVAGAAAIVIRRLARR